MADRTQNISDKLNAGQPDPMDPATLIREEVNQLIEGADLKNIFKNIEDFGRKNPMGLAIAALSIGAAAGILLRKKPYH